MSPFCIRLDLFAPLVRAKLLDLLTLTYHDPRIDCAWLHYSLLAVHAVRELPHFLGIS